METWGLGLVDGLRAGLPPRVRTLWDLVDDTVRETFDDRVPGLAAETALFALMSLPALVLMLLGSLGYVADSLGSDGTAQLHHLVYEVPQPLLSQSTYDVYVGVADAVLAQGRADVAGIGLVLALWTGSRAVNRSLETIVIAYDSERRARRGWRRRVVALLLTVAGLVAAAALIPLLVIGPRLVHLLAPEGVATTVLQALGWVYYPVLGALVVASVTTLYHVGVPWRTPWRRDLPGALLAMGLWMVCAAGLRAYLFVASTGDVSYRHMGTPIAVVLWLWISCISLLLGAELNAEIERTWPTTDEGRRRAAARPPRQPYTVYTTAARRARREADAREDAAAGSPP
ncbi:YihY/virulence factor BrkB family protein [Nocardioides sp. GY 10127]|nr:YihY/virulence factor BrkB family protein [Nocardioides sp. GY 10127]